MTDFFKNKLPETIIASDNGALHIGATFLLAAMCRAPQLEEK
jgi:hypothetical protein